MRESEIRRETRLKKFSRRTGRTAIDGNAPRGCPFLPNSTGGRGKNGNARRLPQQLLRPSGVRLSAWKGGWAPAYPGVTVASERSGMVSRAPALLGMATTWRKRYDHA